jgi:CDP-glucose 4,6-dehydratase
MEQLEIFRNKKILITGTSGFKGSYLALWLNMHGAKVNGFSLEPPTDPNIFESLKLKKYITQYYGDVRDKIRFETIIEETQPEYVFHLAAQPIVKTSYENPTMTFETNILGTLNLMEICKNHNSIKSIVVVTSDKVYKDKYPYIYSEDSELGANSDPYSTSKVCSEFVVESYKKVFKEKGIALATVRAGNVIGGGDWGTNRIITCIIDSLIKNYELGIYSPKAIRPWQSIFDCIYGYMLVSANLKTESWNFGPKSINSITVEELVNKLMKMWGSGNYSIIDKNFEETNYLKLDCEKANRELNWYPKYDINEILNKTVSWYKNFYNNQNMYKFTLEQIKEYEKK